MNNFKNKILLLLINLFMFCSICISQEAQFKWYTELCECEGIFDSTKYSREELENTYNLLWFNPGINTDATVWMLEDTIKLNVVELDEECTIRLHDLRNNKFVNTPFWEQVKLGRITEIESRCELKRITILAYENPTILKQYPSGYDSCKYYADALIAGGHELMNAWKQYNDLWHKENGFSLKRQLEYNLKLNSTDSLNYAELEIMMFGWWNCANQFVQYLEDGGYQDEFEKFFIKFNCDCDEP